jgi:hypothetical protein
VCSDLVFEVHFSSGCYCLLLGELIVARLAGLWTSAGWTAGFRFVLTHTFRLYQVDEFLSSQHQDSEGMRHSQAAARQRISSFLDYKIPLWERMVRRRAARKRRSRVLATNARHQWRFLLHFFEYGVGFLAFSDFTCPRIVLLVIFQ